eukprot:3524839-Amphidinium_carterae.1
MQVEIHTDSSAARAFAQRAVLGKQKHVAVDPGTSNTEQGRIDIRKVRTQENKAGLLTKPTVWSKLHRGLEAVPVALSLQARGLEERQSVVQRLAALELQLQALQPSSEVLGPGQCCELYRQLGVHAGLTNPTSANGQGEMQTCCTQPPLKATGSSVKEGTTSSTSKVLSVQIGPNIEETHCC